MVLVCASRRNRFVRLLVEATPPADVTLTRVLRWKCLCATARGRTVNVTCASTVSSVWEHLAAGGVGITAKTGFLVYDGATLDRMSEPLIAVYGVQALATLFVHVRVVGGVNNGEALIEAAKRGDCTALEQCLEEGAARLM